MGCTEKLVFYIRYKINGTSLLLLLFGWLVGFGFVVVVRLVGWLILFVVLLLFLFSQPTRIHSVEMHIRILNLTSLVTLTIGQGHQIWYCEVNTNFCLTESLTLSFSFDFICLSNKTYSKRDCSFKVPHQ